MFDKDGKLDERTQRILSEQTVPPRYGLSPVMSAGPPMTATEVVAAEKAFFAKRLRLTDQLVSPVFDEMIKMMLAAKAEIEKLQNLFDQVTYGS